MLACRRKLLVKVLRNRLWPSKTLSDPLWKTLPDVVWVKLCRLRYALGPLEILIEPPTVD